MYPGLQWPKMMGGSSQAETGGVQVAGEPAGPGGAHRVGSAQPAGLAVELGTLSSAAS